MATSSTLWACTAHCTASQDMCSPGPGGACPASSHGSEMGASKEGALSSNQMVNIRHGPDKTYGVASVQCGRLRPPLWSCTLGRAAALTRGLAQDRSSAHRASRRRLRIYIEQCTYNEFSVSFVYTPALDHSHARGMQTCHSVDDLDMSHCMEFFEAPWIPDGHTGN